MKQKFFVNKYHKLKETIGSCLPEGSEVTKLDTQCAIITLPRTADRKTVINACRTAVGDDKASKIEAVNSYKVNSDMIEVALPSMKRFFKRSEIS
jgi:hypothetical protein